MSDLVLPPGIQVFKPKSVNRLLQLPKFPYRSLNFEATSKKFGDLEVGASFFYNSVIALYKVSSDTAISTTTGIIYVVNREIPTKEMVFPEVGETIGLNHLVVTAGVISGSTIQSTVPFFCYADARHDFFPIANLYNSSTWKDYDGNLLDSIRSVKKTFILS